MKKVHIVCSDDAKRFQDNLNTALEQIDLLTDNKYVKIKPLKAKYHLFSAMIIYNT
jgi:hypothetical protein